MSNINAKFIKGILAEDQVMIDGICQIAFIGRSNVGKSTTINSILGTKKLVKTGKTPGKTQEINFFEITTNKDIIKYFVDLPGYGYAKLSKNARLSLEKMIYWYIGHKTHYICLIVLIIDSRAGLTSYDVDIINKIKGNNKNFIIAVNKIDKLNQKELSKLKKDLNNKIDGLIENKNVFYYSAKKGKMVHQLRDKIFNL